MSGLTPQQQYDIDQIAATMGLEDMPLNEKTYRYLVQLATGEKKCRPDNRCNQKGVPKWIRYIAIQIHLS